RRKARRGERGVPRVLVVLVLLLRGGREDAEARGHAAEAALARGAQRGTVRRHRQYLEARRQLRHLEVARDAGCGRGGTARRTARWPAGRDQGTTPDG